MSALSTIPDVAALPKGKALLRVRKCPSFWRGAHDRRAALKRDARRRDSRGTHPPPRLIGFGCSHPHPILTSHRLLRDRLRAQV